MLCTPADNGCKCCHGSTRRGTVMERAPGWPAVADRRGLRGHKRSPQCGPPDGPQKAAAAGGSSLFPTCSGDRLLGFVYFFFFFSLSFFFFFFWVSLWSWYLILYRIKEPRSLTDGKVWFWRRFSSFDSLVWCNVPLAYLSLFFKKKKMLGSCPWSAFYLLVFLLDT